MGGQECRYTCSPKVGAGLSLCGRMKERQRSERGGSGGRGGGSSDRAEEGMALAAPVNTDREAEDSTAPGCSSVPLEPSIAQQPSPSPTRQITPPTSELCSLPPHISPSPRRGPLKSCVSPANRSVDSSDRKRDRHCSFGDVHVFQHAAGLDASKLPTDGPGVGLGPLVAISIRRMESFEADRERNGVRAISAEERRRRLRPLHRQASIDEVEWETRVIKAQRHASAHEWNGELDGPRPTTSASSSTAPTLLTTSSAASDIGLCDLWE